MISVLTNLRELIAAYGIPHLNKEEDEQIEQDLLSALNDIEIHSHTRYLSHGNRELVQQSFRIFYSQLRRMFNIIYRKKNRKVDLIILKFHELFQTYEDLYSQDMDLEEPLTDYQYQLLKAEITEKFPPLQEALLKKGIWKHLLLEIQSAIESHFNNASNQLCYYHDLFFNKLLQSLTRMAHDPRDKDWERRFIETMININFNHMGFFNRCSELINFRLSELSDENKIMCIDENELRISQASRDPKLYFDPTRAHLADLLIQYAEQKKSIKPKPIETPETKLEEVNKPEEVLKPVGIPTQLFASHINLFTHYMHLADVYPEDMSKREVCSYVSTCVRTKRGHLVSKDSLEKFDRQKLESGATHVHGIFKKMLQAIERDFDHLGGKNRR
ncbi:hypothetical protein SF1_39560 [Sphingobacterium faecium NBRC 15299]|uniref:hypothetical protein n=1 Tax=Sphingobacterium faecium TaxID=34087 RepID=UPI000D3DB41F|nr:hypothetical protein [Sphingobacterium faecium]PTX10165.1 hypothetical protein C8N37_105173 [Sphingobacterium faecium]GEM65974.1 hypothetical protein SF1_39560 [Sphingobacterium faecium NBRC 15299]